MNPHIENVVMQFDLPDGAWTAEPYGNGHINETYLVTTGEKRFILQRVNGYVFPKPEDVMDNIERVTAFDSCDRPPMPMSSPLVGCLFYQLLVQNHLLLKRRLVESMARRGHMVLAFDKDKEAEPPAELVDLKPTLAVDRLWAANVGSDAEVLRLALGLARDGDTLFALATGRVRASVTLVGAYAAEAVAQAIVRAVRSAGAAGGLPSGSLPS